MESQNHQETIVSQFTRQAIPFAEMKQHSEQRSLEVFRELGRFAGDERVLDSGCGPGLVTHYLAQYVGSIAGLDLTPSMVKLATKKSVELNLGNVSFVEGNMTSLPFSSASFDVSVSRYAFHHLENPKSAFAEMLRVTRPEGKIIVMDVTPEDSKRNSYNRFERLRDPSHTSALTVSEFADLGISHALPHPEMIHFGLEMNAHDLIASSFPEAVSREQLITLLERDLISNTLSFKVRREGDTLIMTFPVTAAVWQLT